MSTEQVIADFSEKLNANLDKKDLEIPEDYMEIILEALKKTLNGESKNEKIVDDQTEKKVSIEKEKEKEKEQPSSKSAKDADKKGPNSHHEKGPAAPEKSSSKTNVLDKTDTQKKVSLDKDRTSSKSEKEEEPKKKVSIDKEKPSAEAIKDPEETESMEDEEEKPKKPKKKETAFGLYVKDQKTAGITAIKISRTWSSLTKSTDEAAKEIVNKYKKLAEEHNARL